MIGIYKIISPTGKTYIGSSLNIENRWKNYYRLGGNIKGQPKLYNSFKKHTPSSHEFLIIHECDESELNNLETIYKQQYIESHGWELALFCNLFDTGGGSKSQQTKDKIRAKNLGQKRTQETKDKISKSKLGIKPSDDTRLKMSNSAKGKSKPEGFREKCSEIKKGNTNRKGSQHTQESKDKIGNANKKSKPDDFKEKLRIIKTGKPILKSRKSVYQYTKDGQFIREWSGASEAEVFYNPLSTFKPDNIGNVCRGKSKTAYGYKWKFKIDEYGI